MYAKCGSAAWMLGECSARGRLEMWSLGTCEMQARAEATRTVSTNGTQ